MRKLTRNPIYTLIIGLIAALGVAPFLLLSPEAAQETKQGKTVDLVAPYWEIGGGFDSTLLINNTRSDSVELHPYLFTSNGNKVSARRIKVPGNGSIDIPLREIADVQNGQGQIGFTYEGAALEVNAQIVIANRERSIAWNHPFEAKNEFSSSGLDGVFYVPGPSTKTEIVLSNTSDRRVTVKMEFHSERSGNNLPTDPAGDSVVLGPRESEVVNVRRFLARDSRGPTAGSVSLTHSGAAGDVRVHGLVSDPDGFSANMRFLERAAMTGSKLFSPILPLRERVSPIVMLSNTNTREINVDVEAYYTLGGNQEERTIHTLSVSPEEVRHVNLTAQMQTLPESATNIGLALSYYAHGGGLLADVLLVDATGSGVYQVTPKGYAMDQHAAHSFPFRIEGNLETIVTVANPSGDKNIVFSLFVLYDGESYTYTGGTQLKPGEVRYINIKTLRDRQTPGLFGKTIPRRLNTGQVKVMFHVKRSGPQNEGGHAGHGGHGYGQAVGTSSVVVYDTVEKISFTSCAPPPVPPQLPDCVLVDVFNDDSGFDCSSPPDSSRIDIFLDEPTVFAIFVGWNGWGVEALTEGILAVYEAGLDFDYNDNYFSVDEEVPTSEVTAIGTGEHELTVSVEHSEGEVGTQVQVRVIACTLDIDVETISPGGGSLPVRNPAKIRTGFAPVFEVIRSNAMCPITWSIVSGPGSIVGSTTSTLVTVSGNSAGTIVLRATTSGGQDDTISVPVVNQQTVDVRVWIVRDNSGANAATTTQRVNQDISDANLIWVQCGIQVDLVSTSFINTASLLAADLAERNQLRDMNTNTGGIEIYYVDSFPDVAFAGATTDDGIVINDDGNSRTAAHELGHAMGLGDAGTAGRDLMHGTSSTTKANIKLSECNALTRFDSN